MHNIIIGAGPAGVVATEALRKQDPDCRITLIGNEPEPPYSRMALPYLLIDKIDETGTHLRKQRDHYEARRIELRRAAVTRLDTAAKTVTLDDGDSLAYDHVLAATGSSPIRPAIDGIDKPSVHDCWTLEDARHIARLAKPGAEVLLMGAGFVGCIVLEALAQAGVKLTVVEMGPRMVPRMLDDTAGGMLRRWCERKGVAVHTGAAVKAIGHKGWINQQLVAELDDGRKIPADLIVRAVGVRPNVGFLEGSGVEVDQGIRVDAGMRANVEGVYAAGDVAQGVDFSTGQYSVQAIQPTAVEHGRVAGINMGGGSARLQGTVNMNVLDTLGLISASFGIWQGADGGETTEQIDHDGYRYLKLCFDGDVLVGAQSVGLTQHIGVLRGLIQGRVPLGVWKDRLLENPGRLMEAYLARQLPEIP